MWSSRIRVVALGAALLLLPAGLARAQRPANSGASVSPADRQFLLDAALAGEHEVQMAMLGVEHGVNNELKVYAQQVLDDHRLSNAEIQALARLKGIGLPEPVKTDASVTKLSRLTGSEFDQAYLHQAIDDHLRDIAMFEKEDQSAGADPDIKGFAHSALPAMRKHLERVQALKL